MDRRRFVGFAGGAVAGPGGLPALDQDHEAEFAVMVDGEVVTRGRREVGSPEAFELRLVGDAMPGDVRLAAADEWNPEAA